jgi:hypothetical protein
MCRFCLVAGADAGATNKRDRSARAASLRALEKKKRLEAAKAQKAEQSKQGVWGALSGALFGTGAGTDVCELSVLCCLRGVPNALCSKHMDVLFCCLPVSCSCEAIATVCCYMMALHCDGIWYYRY